MDGAVAEEYWDRNAGKHREPFAHWENPAPIQERLNALVSGDPRILPPEWFARKYGPFGEVADVGCGDGSLVEYLAGMFPAMRVVGFDFSAGSLEMSRRRCAGLPNAAFEKIDLNAETLLPGSLDAIFTTGAMHHIERLDHCFGSMASALRSGGYLWLNDYVGPARFQWSDTHMRLANDLLATVPAKWRIRDHVTRFDAEAIRATDPSEAVAPHEIEDALFAHFDVVETFDRGGTFLAPIFGSACLSSEMADSPDGLQELGRLFDAERAMIAYGKIKSLHRQYVARPRP